MLVFTRLLLPLVALLAVAPLASCATHAPLSLEDSLRLVDAQLDQIRPVLRGYPPNFSSPTQRGEVEDRWHATEASLVTLQRSNPDDPGVLLRLGELYRLGHNLDVPGAGDRCVSTLERLISIDPSNVEAHLILGIFYTDAGPKWSGEGETELRKAIELAGTSPLPRAWRALVFAYYYQAKFAEAVAAADHYLMLEPEDSDLRKLRQLAFDAAARGATELKPVGRIQLGN